ncbi:MAG: hypothetical protein OES13_10475 [Acidimicrobiia bacterium]|nr:hypothetical protein [Acidimicrobiia bacterium]
MRLNPWFAIPVIAAGVAGALIGRNIARVTCTPLEAETICDPGSSEVVLAVIGAVAAMIGVGVVIVLVIRSLAEWRATSRRPDSD